MLVQEIMDERHPFIFKDELATKARAMIRDFALRILPVVDEDRELQGAVSRTNVMAISSSVSPLRVKGIMSAPKHIATVEDDATSTVREMVRLDEWYLPITSSPQDKTYRGVLGLENFIAASLKLNPKKLSKPVSDVMSKNVVVCDPDQEVDNIWRLMQTRSFAGLPVVRKDKPVGIVTQKDLLESGAELPVFESKKGRFRTSSKISSIMKTTVVTVKPSTKISEAAEIMVSRNIGRIPVTDHKGKLIGIIDREDVAKQLVG